jgi:uncharacterized membrane protein
MATQTEAATAAVSRPRRSYPNNQRQGPENGLDGVTRFLGWFSIGLGVTELLAPRAISRLVGARNHHGVIRWYGLRELSAGIGILTQPKPAGWLWARVGGDAIDMATIAQTLRSPRNEHGRAVGALAAVAGVTALDVICAQRASASSDSAAQRAEASIVIGLSPEEIYRFWRNFENFPRFAASLRSVRNTGERTSHWVASLPATGQQIEWDAELVDDVPNERISWRSLPGAGFSHSGSVEFQAAPANRGTVVRVQLEYSFPGQSLAAPLAALAGKHPQQIVQKNLRRLKQVLETGEVITTEGQSAGRRDGATWLDRIAR